jgi:RNA polymerase sigma-70 factor, ECF subfamily
VDYLKHSIAAEIPSLRRYALALARDRDTADDLVQDCLERALLKRHLWHGDGPIRNWLFRVLHNIHINTVKGPERRYMTGFASSPEPGIVQPACQEQRMECTDLAVAMDKLPVEQREAIVLVAVEGRPYDEAAGILGVPVGTVRSRLSRGRETLRTLTGSIWGC